VNIIPLTIESLVALLLLMTILYCVRLNAQLTRLRADETVMKEVIAELNAATDRSERSIAALKATVEQADADLGDRLRVAERFCADMTRQSEAGTVLLQRLTQIASARSATAEPPSSPFQPAAPDPKALVAAAQAFTERARALIKDRAA
jgi:Domain of unknown function (DUF6468)